MVYYALLVSSSVSVVKIRLRAKIYLLDQQISKGNNIIANEAIKPPPPPPSPLPLDTS